MGTTTSQCFPLLSCHSSHRHHSTLISKKLIDLNRASEDELLSLPGIDRDLTQNILEYRQKHNGFQQIEELLQVNGVDTNLFKNIRSEIFVDLPSSVENDETKSKLVNLNLASIERLCSVPGLTPILVKRIVQRRERKGSFRFIEDLLEVKGVDYIVLAQVRPHVTVNPSTLSTSHSQSSIDNLHQPILNGNRRKTRVGSSVTDTFSIASQLLETLPPELQTLLLTSSTVKSSTKVERDKSSFRCASWNLQRLTDEKVRNPGVREVICRTIFDHHFSLIACQEIENEQTLNAIVDELNNPTIPSLKESIGCSTQRWKSIINQTDQQMKTCRCLGFIYDESSGIEFRETVSFQFDRSVFVVQFRLNGQHDWLFVNVHLTTEESDENQMKWMTAFVDTIEKTRQETSTIILGTFDLIASSPVFGALIDHQYVSMIDMPTDISLSQIQGSACLDNIWLSSTIKPFHTKRSGVIRDNLTSLWIPAGWNWGGLVSNHCPIWTDFDSL